MHEIRTGGKGSVWLTGYSKIQQWYILNKRKPFSYCTELLGSPLVITIIKKLHTCMYYRSIDYVQWMYLTLYLVKADTAIFFSSFSCFICSFKYLENKVCRVFREEKINKCDLKSNACTFTGRLHFTPCISGQND